MHARCLKTPSFRTYKTSYTASFKHQRLARSKITTVFFVRRCSVNKSAIDLFLMSVIREEFTFDFHYMSCRCRPCPKLHFHCSALHQSKSSSVKPWSSSNHTTSASGQNPTIALFSIFTSFKPLSHLNCTPHTHFFPLSPFISHNCVLLQAKCRDNSLKTKRSHCMHALINHTATQTNITGPANSILIDSFFYFSTYLS